MRLLSRLLVVIVICLVAMAIPASPAQAAGASITLRPESGVPGEEIEVRGYNFTAEERVYIYYDGEEIDIYDDGEEIDYVETDEDGDFPWVSFIVPESCTGDHEVLAEDREDIDADADFTVEPGLTVDPEEGPVGTNVTVEGHGFAEDEEDIELRYYINGKHKTVKDNIPANEDGWWKWSFPIPASAQGDHDIDAQGDESSLHEVEDAIFKVTPEINIIDQSSGSVIDEPSGSVADNITTTGSGFVADERDITILFDGEAVKREIRANDIGSWNGSFVVPEMPLGTYEVTAEGEQTEEEDVSALSFEIEPGLVLSPVEGHVGTSVTAAGHGFAAGSNVVIKYDGSEVATSRTNAEGSFPGVSFSVPEGTHGAHQVTARDAAANEATAIFTMEANRPPIPEVISPPDGSRVGFIGAVMPTFEWFEVSDASGVYYSLQIATSDNTTATGEFFDPVVSVPDLVGTNYTLDKTEALPYGTYYWIVQAVDGAENESGWTEASSFQAGVMPLWAFIIIIVAVAVGIGAAVYFFVIRKKIHYY